MTETLNSSAIVEGANRVREYFDRIGNAIDDAWRPSFYEDRKLLLIAERVSSESPPHLGVRPETFSSGR